MLPQIEDAFIDLLPVKRPSGRNDEDPDIKSSAGVLYSWSPGHRNDGDVVASMPEFKPVESATREEDERGEYVEEEENPVYLPDVPHHAKSSSNKETIRHGRDT